jgi:hypothetical protein
MADHKRDEAVGVADGVTVTMDYGTSCIRVVYAPAPGHLCAFKMILDEKELTVEQVMKAQSGK